jgi:mannose-1-phosphate guanylyltransferase/phosphomannomutase
VLAKLGADVLAVNPYASTPGTLAFDRETNAANVADLVRSSGASLGVVIDPDGEHATFVDDDGHVLTDTEALLATVSLVGMSGHPGARIAVPVVAPVAARKLAEAAGVELIETKLATPSLMAAAQAEGVLLAASLDGGFIFPSFGPGFDAMAALVHLLSMLADGHTRLAKVVGTLPRTHVAHETVATPSEQKGAVMRSLMEVAQGELVLVDGIKAVEVDGWALVLPDPEDPVTHVYAEGPTGGDARRRCQTYISAIRKLLR